MSFVLRGSGVPSLAIPEVGLPGAAREARVGMRETLDSGEGLVTGLRRRQFHFECWRFGRLLTTSTLKPSIVNIMSLSGDEHLYAKVADELESGDLDKGIWTKALAENEFDEAKAKADYVETRVSQMKGAIALEAERKAAEQARLAAETERHRKEVVKEAAFDAVQNYRKTVHKRGDFRLMVAAVVLVAIWFFWSNC